MDRDMMARQPSMAYENTEVLCFRAKLLWLQRHRRSFSQNRWEICAYRSPSHEEEVLIWIQ